MISRKKFQIVTRTYRRDLEFTSVTSNESEGVGEETYADDCTDDCFDNAGDRRDDGIYSSPDR